MSWKKIIILVLALGPLTLAACASSGKPTESTSGSIPSVAKLGPKTYANAPPMFINVNKQYTATIQTNKGDLVLELFAKDVPVTVNNFVFLARDGFYDGTIFHRVISNFMAQGGDPTGTGTGGPGYRFKDEFSSHTHVTGALSMANSGPNTNGSQFFITYSPQHHLDGVHSVFGQLVKGSDVLLKIQQGDKIIHVTITEK